MPDHDEVMARLRDADPVAGSSVPSPDAPGPRAMREKIMTDPIAPKSRAPMIAAIAATIATLGAAVTFVAMRDGTTPAPDSGGEPVSPGGMAMCVEMYDTTTLAKREIAFAGTVVSVDGDEVTFRVDEGFRGLDGDDQVTLEGASSFGGMTSVSEGVALDPGAKLLVAGDDHFAWSCGFTQAYSASVAAQWRSTFAS